MAVEIAEILRSKGWRITDEALRQGLRDARWAGRFEILRRGGPDVLIDAGHNPQGARVLAENLRLYFPGRKCTFIMGCLAKKDHRAMLAPVLPLARRFLTVTPGYRGALPAQDLAALIRSYGADAQACETVPAAVDLALELVNQSGDDDCICAFGSIYYIGEVCAHLRGDCQ